MIFDELLKKSESKNVVWLLKELVKWTRESVRQSLSELSIIEYIEMTSIDGDGLIKKP